MNYVTNEKEYKECPKDEMRWGIAIPRNLVQEIDEIIDEGIVIPKDGSPLE